MPWIALFTAFAALAARAQASSSQTDPSQRACTVQAILATEAPVRLGGGFNEGFHFYADEQGREHAVKLLEPRFTPAIEVRNAHLMEQEGGPRLYGHGILKSGNMLQPYLDLETLFPRQRFFTMKDTLRKAPAWPFPAVAAISETIGDRLFHAFSHGIAPSDPDFAVTEQGEVRWIDSGLWEVRDDFHSEGEFVDKTSEILFEAISDLENNEATLQVLDTYLARLKQSELPLVEKQSLIDAVGAQVFMHCHEPQMKGFNQLIGLKPGDGVIAARQKLMRYYESLRGQ